MNMSFKQIKLTRTIITIVFAMICSTGFAAEQAQGKTKSRINELDNTQELAAFMDGTVNAHLRTTHTPGATVSIVKDGKLIFARGYGFADVEKQIPVSAESTLFRIASITKIFTATAIMQLVEQGKLDLDTDVNTYLAEFKIKNNFPEPVTLRHLMTHSAGFEESRIDQIIVDYKEGDSENSILEDLKTHFPEQVRAPGTYASYSNHGISLTGRIIEIASGQSYHDYLEQHILKPLSMLNTTARQPLPEHLKETISVGYYSGEGPFRPGPFNIAVGTAAGSISSSATDMAKFMIMHLQKGEYEGQSIISTHMASTMQSQQFTHDPRLPGMALQFIESSVNDERTIGHGGSLLRHLSQVVLIPELGVGIFVSFNSANGQPQRLVQQFLDRYTFAEATHGSLDTTAERLPKIVGSYISLRRGYTHFAKLLTAVPGRGSIEVSDLGNGKIGLGGSQYHEIEPFVFQQINGHERLVFKTNEEGDVSHLFFNPTSAYEKSTGFQSIGVQQMIGLSTMIIFVFSTLVWVFSSFRGLFVSGLTSAFEKKAWGVTAIPGFLIVFMLMAFPVDSESILNGLPTLFVVALNLNYLMIPVFATMLYFTFQGWRKGLFSIFDRLLYSILSLLLFVTIWWFDNWHIMGSG
jgi:CubicO group peptidase (beta-lactamase class C family)